MAPFTQPPLRLLIMLEHGYQFYQVGGQRPDQLSSHWLVPTSLLDQSVLPQLLDTALQSYPLGPIMAS